MFQIVQFSISINALGLTVKEKICDDYKINALKYLVDPGIF